MRKRGVGLGWEMFRVRESASGQGQELSAVLTGAPAALTLVAASLYAG